jgi:hypothetical protein
MIDTFSLQFSQEVKPKGVQGLIEVENPNRALQKPKKVSDVVPTEKSVEKPTNTKAILSRRER